MLYPMSIDMFTVKKNHKSSMPFLDDCSTISTIKHEDEREKSLWSKQESGSSALLSARREKQNASRDNSRSHDRENLFPKSVNRPFISSPSPPNQKQPKKKKKKKKTRSTAKNSQSAFSNPIAQWLLASSIS